MHSRLTLINCTGRVYEQVRERHSGEKVSFLLRMHKKSGRFSAVARIVAL